MPAEAEAAARLGEADAIDDEDVAPLVSPPPANEHRRSAAASAAGAASSAARRWLEALTCLLLVALIWVAAAASVQLLFSESFAVPFTLTYINNSEFIILLPLSWARERWLGSLRSDWRGAARAGALVCPLWFLAQGAYNASLGATSVSSSTVLSSASCVFTLALSALLLRERVRCGNVIASRNAAALLVELVPLAHAAHVFGHRQCLAQAEAGLYAGVHTGLRHKGE
jgi:hypothetical protein